MKKMIVRMLTFTLLITYTTPLITYASETNVDLSTAQQNISGVNFAYIGNGLYQSLNNRIIDNTKPDLSKFDDYVSVENNQYVLTLPEYHTFTAPEILQVQMQIKETNLMIAESQAFIDVSTDSVGCIAGGLAAYFSFGSLAAAVTRVVGAMFGAYVANKIPHGIWFNLNYFCGITNYGWQ